MYGLIILNVKRCCLLQRKGNHVKQRLARFCISLTNSDFIRDRNCRTLFRPCLRIHQ